MPSVREVQRPRSRHAALDPEMQEHPVAALARPRAGRAGAAQRRWADGGARAARDPAAGLGSGGAPTRVFALRKVAEERVGQLIDALIDPNQDFAVRRRLARVFSVCVSQRAADGLMLGLEDLRFEVRFQCGRSLASMLEKNPAFTIDSERIFGSCSREVAVGRPVWESRRLLDEFEVQDALSFVDEFVRDRAGQSLAHVFTLLSLVLPREPLQIAFRGLHTDDRIPAGHGARVPGRRAAGADPRAAVAVSRGSPSGGRVRPPARRDPRGSAAVEPVDHAEPRGAEACGPASSRSAGAREERRVMTQNIDRAARCRRRRRARRVQRITGRLPDDLLTEQVQRLAVFSAVGAGLWAFGLVMDTPASRPRTVGTSASRTVAIGDRDRRGRRVVVDVPLRALRAATAADEDRRRPVVHGAQRDRRRAAQHLGDGSDVERRWTTCRGTPSSSSSRR